MSITEYPKWNYTDEVLNCVYAYVNRDSGMAYIGQTKSMQVRYHQHCMRKRVKKGTIDYVLKHTGLDSFDVYILAKDLTPEEMNTIETEKIAEFDTYNNGYNKTQDGKAMKVNADNTTRSRKEGDARKEPMSVGEQVAMLRTHNNLTQHQLAKLAHCCLNTISQIESNKLTEQTKILIKIGEVLGNPIVLTKS